MIKNKITFAVIFICLLIFSPVSSKATQFLLFGISVKPAPSSLSNSWVVSQGQDFSIIDFIAGGYEAGLAYRIYNDKAEYHFKTFFNSKFTLIDLKKTSFYLGGGAGFLELIKVSELERSLKFFFAYQGIIGLKIGFPTEDQFCIEIQFLKSMEEERGLQINLLAGVRF
jgi:hypothetical protein